MSVEGGGFTNLGVEAKFAPADSMVLEMPRSQISIVNRSVEKCRPSEQLSYSTSSLAFQQACQGGEPLNLHNSSHFVRHARAALIVLLLSCYALSVWKEYLIQLVGEKLLREDAIAYPIREVEGHDVRPLVAHSRAPRTVHLGDKVYANRFNGKVTTMPNEAKQLAAPCVSLAVEGESIWCLLNESHLTLLSSSGYPQWEASNAFGLHSNSSHVVLDAKMLGNTATTILCVLAGSHDVSIVSCCYENASCSCKETIVESLNFQLHDTVDSCVVSPSVGFNFAVSVSSRLGVTSLFVIADSTDSWATAQQIDFPTSATAVAYDESANQLLAFVLSRSDMRLGFLPLIPPALPSEKSESLQVQYFASFGDKIREATVFRAFYVNKSGYWLVSAGNVFAVVLRGASSAAIVHTARLHMKKSNAILDVAFSPTQAVVFILALSSGTGEACVYRANVLGSSSLDAVPLNTRFPWRSNAGARHSLRLSTTHIAIVTESYLVVSVPVDSSWRFIGLAAEHSGWESGDDDDITQANQSAATQIVVEFAVP